jgi:hypothetical protein
LLRRVVVETQRVARGEKKAGRKVYKLRDGQYRRFTGSWK